jgi:acyl-CoA synthetase
MLGYLDPAANRAALDDSGWLSTGDVGVVDGSGFVTITGRLKDVINRGGEKFSARDIEDLLIMHPAVRNAAVVPGPDARFGEVPVAFVVFEGGSRPSADELTGHLRSSGLARQKTPVAWHFVDALPMTPSGKVKKFELAATAEEAERAQQG